MKRFIEERLLEWKNSTRRKPLLVRGARQVGKTYSIQKFGRSMFTNLVTVDLEKERKLHGIFEADLNSDRIISELEIVLNEEITPNKSLLFIDEIQSCPRAIMALRYFYEEIPDLHVIAAGSLLEFSMSDISFPVGRIQFLDMTPLTFPEYLLAIGREEAANIVSSKPKAVSGSIHRILLDELKIFCFVGGMPESVKVYVESKSLKESFSVHKELCESFRHDFSKYTPRIGTDCIDSVLTGTAQHVGQQIIYTHLTDMCTHPTVKKAFHTLCKARVINMVSSASPAGLPLKATASSKRFKAIIVDIGLWQHLNGIDVAKEYPKTDLLTIYQGAMAEQFVGQEILAAQNSSLYYWARSAKGSTAEVDYLAAIDGKVVPVEVKSGSAGRLRSLHLLLNTYQNCPFGLIFSSAPFSVLKEQRLIFVPLYYAYSMTKGA
ncbi:MAG: ATP-binding protein [Deltaproteobacteria bacterium]|nr:ATP-binding protein [Deltaproteobacteria bacterium]